LINYRKRNQIFRFVKEYKFSSIFSKLFIVLVSIITLLAIIQYATVYYIRQVMLQKEIKLQQTYLQYNSNYVDSVIENINKFLYSIENDNDVKVLYRSTKTDYFDKKNQVFYKEILNVSERLLVYKTTIDDVSDVLIYFPAIDRIVNAYGLNYTYDYFKLRYTGDYESWRKSLLSKNNSLLSIIRNNVEDNNKVLSMSEKPAFSRSTSSQVNLKRVIGYRDIAQASIIFNFNERFFMKLFSDDEFVDKRKIYMVDSNNKIISCNTDDPIGSNFDFQLNNKNRQAGGYYFYKDYIVAYKNSEYSNINYVVFTPKELIFADINNINAKSNILMLILLIIGVFFAFTISKRFYVPIISILNDLESSSTFAYNNDKKGGEIKLIKNNLMSIASSKVNLEQTVKDTMPYIINNILGKIITGDCEADKAKIMCKQYGIIFKDYFYCAGTIVIKNIDYNGFLSNFNTIDVYKLIDKHLSDYVISAFKSFESQYVFVMHLKDKGELKDIVDRQKKLCNEFYSLTDQFSIYSSIGDVYNDIFQMNLSHKQALNVISLRGIKDEESVLVYEVSNNMKKDVAVMPVDMEQRILNIIVSGNVDAALRYINEVIDLNYRKNITFQAYFNLASTIQSIIIRIVSDWSFESDEAAKKAKEQLEYINEYDDTIIISSKIIKNINTLCVFYAEKKSNNDYIEDIIKFIDDNFNKNISLDFVADKFKYNSSYLSKVLKQYTGVSFTDYINKRKIDLAKSLLVESDMQIKEIGERVGYNSSSMFIRTFQKYSGTTPGEFRKSKQVI
jgi:AraC-like DNA-binding protein